MRVLLVTPDFPPTLGGIQRLLHRITGAMPDSEIQVVTLRVPGWEEFDQAAAFEVTRVRPVSSSPVVRNAAFNVAAVASAPRWRPDVVLNGHVVCGPAAYWLARRYGVANVLYTYGKEVMGRPRTTAWCVRHSTAVVAISEFTRRQVLSTVDGDCSTPIVVVNPGSDLPTKPGRADADRPTVVTTARLRDWYKGHDVMLEALPAVIELVPTVQWVVIGDGRIRRDLECRAKTLGVTDHVTFLGAVSDATRDEWLARAHVFAMPARYPKGEVAGEGFGIVHLEAAGWGLPAIAGRLGGPAEAIVDGETGLLVDAESPESVAGALTRLLLDPEYARRLGAAGRARLSTQFTWRAVGEQLRRALADAAAEAGREM